MTKTIRVHSEFLERIKESPIYQEKMDSFFASKRHVKLRHHRYSPSYFVNDVLGEVYSKDGVHVDYGFELEDANLMDRSAKKLLISISQPDKVFKRIAKDAEASFREFPKHVEYVVSYYLL